MPTSPTPRPTTQGSRRTGPGHLPLWKDVQSIVKRYPPLDLFLTTLALSTIYNSLLSLYSRRPFKLRPNLLSSLRLATILSAYSHSYKTLLACFKSPGSILAYHNPLFKSFLASLVSSSLLALLPRSTTLGVTFYLLANTIRTLSPSSLGASKVPPVLVFSLSNAILLHSFLFNSNVFPKPYSNFILNYSKSYISAQTTSATLLSELRTLTSISPTYPLLSPLSTQTPPLHSRVVCVTLHPEEPSCGKVAFGAVKKEFKKGLPFFGAVSLLGVGFNTSSFFKNPARTIQRVLISTISSSLFLSLAINTAWSTICFFQRVLPSQILSKERFYLQGFLAGLWIILLPSSRTTDLATYAGRMALQLKWEAIISAATGKVKKRFRFMEWMILAISLSSLMSVQDKVKSGLLKKGLTKLGEYNQ